MHKKLSFHMCEQENPMVLVLKRSKPCFSSRIERNSRFGGAIVGARAQDCILGLGLYLRI